ncbi:restriction endonuclease [Lichenicoccus sp.]|uniref:restriction endonuclease n=1 Tax=Lichenicoccus sp. TaxID=2781899 RepID=UPI003D0F3C10
MRQLPLIGLLLLLPTTGFSEELYHVRHVTHACIDPAALAARSSSARARGHCFRVAPWQHWERLPFAGRRGLLLLRREPPHAGEPPLFFRRSSVRAVHGLAVAPHDRQTAHEPRTNVTSAAAMRAVVPPPPAAPLRAIAPLVSLPPPPPPPVTTPVTTHTPPQTPARTVQTQRSSHLFAVVMLWALIIIVATLLVRFVLARLKRTPLQAEAEDPPPAVVLPLRHEESSPAAEPPSDGDYKARCVVRLRHAGWDARTRFSTGLPGPDVIARSNGLVLALQCHTSGNPVDVDAVREACMVREHQHSDLAAIVSNAPFTEAARQLAARTGIVLLHEDELASFAA